MSEAFVKIDLHGLRQEEAIRVIDKAMPMQVRLPITCS